MQILKEALDGPGGVRARRPGRVEHPQGKTRGKIKKKLTSRTEVSGQTVAASEDAPRYLVESDKSGKEAAHKPGALDKV